MPSLSVIVDTPSEFTLSGDSATSQVQIAKTGTFTDPRYGTFKITLADFHKWVANFKALSKSAGRLGLPIDVDHAPELKGDTEAAGWITNLAIKGNELWATAEWNSLGKELVADRRYAYLSPSYKADLRDETGKSHGTALVGAALTNRPFLSMATVSLSQCDFAFATEVLDPSSTQENMPLDKILSALGLAADADEATILSKLSDLKSTEQPKTVSLADQAKAEGMVLLSTDQLAGLTEKINEGAAAAASLSDMRFEQKFDKLLTNAEGALVLPAQKDMYKALYEVDADKTIALMDALKTPLVTGDPTGSNGTKTDPSTTLSSDMRDDEFGTPDEDRIALHNLAVKYEREDKMSYGDALMRAAQELS